VFGQDEAGPCQCPSPTPAPPAHWQATRSASRTSTCVLRAAAVIYAPNAVLHPWLQRELGAALDLLPPTSPDAPYPEQWEGRTGLGHEPAEPLPRPRAILIWDNLAGHTRAPIVSCYWHRVCCPTTPR
jgi:hypothetical protein